MLGFWSFGPRALAAAAEPETIDPAASCVTSECHSFVEDYEEVHWSELAEPGQCQECHEPEGDLHEFETDDSPTACLRCHDELAATLRSAKHVHEAVEDSCIDCHDPHGGEDEALLSDVEDEDMKELCFSCHESEILDEEYTHGPVDQGSCTECHDPHASDFGMLLHAEGRELCGDCHDDIIEELEAAEFVHDPAQEDCIDCHNPHSGPEEYLLPAEGRELCGECHDDVVELAEDSAVRHDATTEKKQCLSCHSPHAANHEPILRMPQRELCLDCHDRALRSGQTMLVDMKQWLMDNPEWHEPIREDECSGCHNPHGSEKFRLLKEEFPRSFYSPFEVDAYALCFSCHESELVTSKHTRRSTEFRDGNRNLHFLHVNREKRGRSCRACHETHAGPLPKQVRETTPYGRWLMPLNFEKTETGGSCLPGCHKRQGYDRDAVPGRGAE